MNPFIAKQPPEGAPPRRRLLVHPAIRTYREPLYRRLGQDGFEFLWTSINTDRRHEALEVQAILSRFPYPHRTTREWKFLPFSNFSPDLLRVFSYDLVVFSGLTSVPLAVCAFPLHLLNRRVVLFDELWRYPYELPAYRAAFPYLKALVNRCVSAVVAASSKARSFYERELGFPADRIFIARNATEDLGRLALSQERLAEVKREIDARAEGRVVLLYLGRIVEYKGLDVLIRAMTLLPPSVCLMVVGDGPFRQTCQALVEQLGLAARVFFLGGCRSDEAAYYYKAADVFVLPTRFLLTERVNCESWGFTVNEAMSLGVPVVATTAVGAAFDLIKPGESGLQAEAGNHEDLAARLGVLVQDAQLRRQLGEAGRAGLAGLCSEETAYQAFSAAIARATQA